MQPEKSWIHKLNVVRFETLLLREKDTGARETLSSLLAQENGLLLEALRREAASPAADALPENANP